MAIGKGGNSGSQSGASSGTSSGTTSGTSSGNTTQSQTGSITPTTTEGWGNIDAILRSAIGNDTGLNAGQTDAYNQLLGWRENPANTVNQIDAVNPQLQGWINQGPAQAASGGAVTANQGSQYMGSYANPFENQVVQSTVADLTNEFDKTQNKLRAAYGGQGWSPTAGAASGVQVAAAQGADDFLRTVGSTVGGLRSQGFNTAAGLGQGDANRFYGASGQNAANANQLNMYNAGLEAQKQMANVNAMRDIVNNAVTAGAIGTDTAKTLFDMSGGGNTNLFNYLQTQPQGQTSAGDLTSSTQGSTTGAYSGQQSGTSSGNSSSKGGGISLG